MKRLLALSLLLPGLALAQAAPAKPAPKAARRTAPAPQRNEESEAGDVAEIDKDARGPLRERIRPVSGQLYVREGRFEIAPTAQVSFRDAFFQKFILGGSLTYYPAEWLGVSAYGGYSLPTVAGSAQICTDTGCAAPTFERLDGAAPGQIKLLAGADVLWSPIYGKMSLLAESFAHFDLYLIGGVAGVQYGAPNGDENVTGSVPTFTVGGNIGLGGHVHLNRFIAIRAELRDLIYQETTLTGPVLNNQFLFNLGLSFFLPTSFEAR